MSLRAETVDATAPGTSETSEPNADESTPASCRNIVIVPKSIFPLQSLYTLQPRQAYDTTRPRNDTTAPERTEKRFCLNVAFMRSF